MKLKINFQKILAVLTVISFVISLVLFVISVSVFADDESEGMTLQEYYAGQNQLIAWWCDGKITYQQYTEQADAHTQAFYDANTAHDVVMSWASTAGNRCKAVGLKIGTAIDQYGEKARDVVAGWLSDLFDDYKTEVDEPLPDMRGRGAYIEFYDPKRPGFWGYYADYIVLEGNKDGKLTYSLHDTYTKVDGYWYPMTNPMYIDYDNSLITTDNLSLLNKLIGDIRYVDNFDPNSIDIPIDSGTVTNTDYDFTQVPETELEELLNKILESFELNNPDLSSIEGLLQAIYYRLGTLDSDNDNGLLSLINASINKLSLDGDGGAGSEKVIEKLEEYINGTDDKTGLMEYLKQLVPDIDDMTNTELVKAVFVSKFAFIEEIKALINSFITSYSRSSSDAPKIHVEFYNDNFLLSSFGYDIDLSGGGLYDKNIMIIRYLAAGFIYLTYAWNLYRKFPSYISGGGD